MADFGAQIHLVGDESMAVAVAVGIEATSEKALPHAALTVQIPLS
jgi:hypothetical protein